MKQAKLAADSEDLFQQAFRIASILAFDTKPDLRMSRPPINVGIGDDNIQLVVVPSLNGRRSGPLSIQTGSNEKTMLIASIYF